MRTAVIYGIRDGGPEEVIKTVSSAKDGIDTVDKVREDGYYTEVVVRDCLGGLRARQQL